jgi:hypothetical protein
MVVRISISVIFLASVLNISQSLKGVAQVIDIPTDSMPVYAIYRQELIRKGWLPVPQKFGIRLGMPEVVCGASERLCTAYWLYSKPTQNRERKFILWGTLRGLVVAPYLDNSAI